MTPRSADGAKGAAARANPRALAAHVLAAVDRDGRYLDAALEAVLGPSRPPHAALVQELAYGVLRRFHELEAVAALFLDKPLKPKDRDVYLLLLVGLYQLRHMRVARHAAVTETVEAATALKKPWAKKLLNACLRAALRDPARIEWAIAQKPSAAFSHPAWLIEAIQRDWPRDWEKILSANNERPPLVLRINARRGTRAQYLARLVQAGIAAAVHPVCDSAVVLDTPLAVEALPGFADGDVSVQDAAAQFAAGLLDPQPGERVLDACAAPGGKTGHLLEWSAAPFELVALDREPTRVALIRENLARLKLTARTVTGDAAAPETWWSRQAFDRIVADVPCSASGVIRRHPDIKLRRRPEDLPRLIATQERILEGLWPLLKPGGKLLYVSCSIFPGENENQMTAFLRRHADAVEDALPLTVGRARPIGRQILPGEAGMDGFYYARLHKN